MYSFKAQNEKGNLSYKMSLVTVVMPNIKVRCPSWIGMLFQMSLYSYIWVFYDEALESCWSTFAVYGGVWHFSKDCMSTVEEGRSELL